MRLEGLEANTQGKHKRSENLKAPLIQLRC